MAWYATNKALKSKQIAARDLDENIFGVKTENSQEIYLGFYEYDDEFAESIDPISLKFEYIPRTKNAEDTTGAGVAIETIIGYYNANVTWETRPASDTSAELAASTQYASITPNVGSGFTLDGVSGTDAASNKMLIRNILKGARHIRILPIGAESTKMVVTMGKVGDPVQWAQPYYTVSWNNISAAQGVQASNDAPELAIYGINGEVKSASKLFTGSTPTFRGNRLVYGAVKNSTTQRALAQLKVEYSADGGQTWQTANESEVPQNGIIGRVIYFKLPQTVKGNVELKVTLTDVGGKYSYWQKTLNAYSPVPYITIVSPSYEYVNGDNGITFKWNFESDVGATQKGCRITNRPLEAQGAKLVFASMDYASQQVTVNPINFSGKQRINIGVYASDNQYNETYTDIVVLKSPTLGTLSATTKPLPRVRITSSDAVTYELNIDNGALYQNGIVPVGDTQPPYDFYPDVILPDGKHTFSARARNKLGMSGAWQNVEAATANTPGAAITLSCAASGHKAALSWTTTGTYDSYRVYRDGKEIGRTTNMHYADEYAAPTTHTYTVYGIMMAADGSGGDYTLSNAVTAALKISGAVIAATDTGGALEWLSLRLGTDVERAVSRSVVQDVTYTHYAGRDLPVAELSEYRDESYSGTVVLTDPADRARFEALLGHEVCYKRRGISVMGMMAELSSRHTRARYDAEYSFTIRAIDSEVR